MPDAKEACALGPLNTIRLHLRDLISGKHFLIDSGAEVSILPKPDNWKGQPLNCKLYAANKSQIKVYGIANRIIKFVDNKPLVWQFYIADVPYPIFGGDALAHFHLLPDLKNRTLIDSEGQIFGQGSICSAELESISLIDQSSPLKEVLGGFPSVIGITEPISIPKQQQTFHHVETTGPPIAQKARRLSIEKLKLAKAEISRLCKLGLMRPSKSPWSSPIHIVIKNKKVRVVGDYRRLNACTKPDKYPVKRLMDFTTILYKAKIFSTLDLKRAFHQIPVNPADIEKTALITPFGLFESLVMTFGLKCAAQSFQRYADEALGDLPFVFVYIDDILVASSSWEQHLEHIKIVLERLKAYALQLNLEKCVLAKPEVSFLGFLVNENGYQPLPAKVKAVTEFPKPQTVDQLRRFLGMVNFYRECIPRAAHSQSHLNKYLTKAKKKDKTPIQWNDESDKAFETCKNDLANVTLMAFPDENSDIRLVSDASDFSMGSSIEQFSGTSWRPLAFFSRKFTPAQTKYSTYDRELTAIYESVKHFYYCLEGRPFQICTDHKPLLYLFNQKHDKAPSHRTRQITFLSQFLIQMSYLPGNENVVADALSRVDAISEQPFLAFSDPEPNAMDIAAFHFPTIFNIKELSKLQNEDAELKSILENKNHSFQLQKITCGPENVTIYCNIFEQNVRPYIPNVLRKKIIELYHLKAHPSARVTDRLVRRQYIWPNVTKDIKIYCKNCIRCQASKISRHNRTTPAHFDTPDARFQHVHIDLVGPLLPSNNYRYLLTVVDRYTRWPEAYPIMDMTAKTVAREFFRNWISRFGSPTMITTDQGTQFESDLYNELARLSGSERIHTTSYHPRSNGMVERWHRDLKAALMCVGTCTDWYYILDTVLLGLRTRVRLDNGFSPAEMLYGNALRIPGDFFSYEEPELDSKYFMNEFRKYLHQVKPVPTPHHSKKNLPLTKPFYFKDMDSSSHVFKLVKKVKPPLVRPYTGPHRILKRHPTKKYFKIDINGNPSVVSTEHLKPAYFIPENVNLIPPNQPPAQVPQIPIHQNIQVQKTTVELPVTQPTVTYADKVKRVKFVPNILRRSKRSDPDLTQKPIKPILKVT